MSKNPLVILGLSILGFLYVVLIVLPFFMFIVACDSLYGTWNQLRAWKGSASVRKIDFTLPDESVE